MFKELFPWEKFLSRSPHGERGLKYSFPALHLSD